VATNAARLEERCIQTAYAAKNTASDGFVFKETDGIRERSTRRAAVASYPTIAATATALPPHTITRDDVKVYNGTRV